MTTRPRWTVIRKDVRGHGEVVMPRDLEGRCGRCGGGAFAYNNGGEFSEDGVRGYRCYGCGNIKPEGWRNEGPRDSIVAVYVEGASKPIQRFPCSTLANAHRLVTALRSEIKRAGTTHVVRIETTGGNE